MMDLIIVQDNDGAIHADLLVRCKDCIYAESFFESYRCYFDEENESGCKRSHDADFFCAYGEVGK